MGSLVLPSDRLSLKEQLDSLPTAELKRELAGLLALTASNLLRLAVIVSILEDRGEDMTALKGGFLDILRKIACGQLLPDLVILFSGDPAKIQKAASMPLEDQREVASGRKAIPDRQRHRRNDGPPERPTLPNVFRSMGENGSPRDVGETAAEMILACKSPTDAARHLLSVLTRAGVKPL